MSTLVEGAGEERRVDAHDRVESAVGQARRRGDRVLFGDADVEDPVGNSAANFASPTGVSMAAVTATISSRSSAISQISVPNTEVHDVDFRRCGFPGDRVDDADGVELVRIVVDGRVVAVALLRDHVDDDGSAVVLLGPLQRLFDFRQVVAVDGAQVLDAEFVEHSRLGGLTMSLSPRLTPWIAL
jgi:hypothetical protein